ncbi:MAG: DegT/DnrJ/EryC1/StrS family aminotransferase [Candidatus Zixiibacteriota bacterium]|nr:MAG: DegT/DnrJ/EryC1/StrS family aminotransferase [candidate division Zixibacteria bacterium]
MKKNKTLRRVPLHDIKLSGQAIKHANETLKSGWLSPGPKVAAFEKALCEMMRTRYGAAVASATAGLELVLTSIGAQPGKEVVTTPLTFVGTIEAILSAGATPVFADIDPQSLNIDPDEVFRKITHHTIAVMPVDIAGYPADYRVLKKICDTKSVPLIADAAHSVGSAYRGKPIPGHTDAAVISFHATKNLTCGEGGMVLSKHKAIIDAVRIMSRHGLTSSAYQRKKAARWDYDAMYPGYKANMSEVHAAIGLGQLSVFQSDQEKRRRLAGRYMTGLSGLTEYIELPPQEKHCRHGWHLFIIKLRLSRLRIKRDTFIEKLAGYGVECGVHYKPIFELSYYREILGETGQYLPNATYAGRRIVTLPLYPGLKMTDVNYVCECIAKVIKQYGRK